MRQVTLRRCVPSPVSVVTILTSHCQETPLAFGYYICLLQCWKEKKQTSLHFNNNQWRKGEKTFFTSPPTCLDRGSFLKVKIVLQSIKSNISILRMSRTQWILDFYVFYPISTRIFGDTLITCQEGKTPACP